MIVEPMAGDRVEDNFNPVGRAYYGFSTFLCTPASLSQEVGLALGAQAAKRGSVTSSRRAGSPASAGLPRRPSTWCSRPGCEHYDRPRGPQRHRDPARVPDQQGFVERDGVRVHWEAYGDGGSAILLMPTWSVIHSRHWKAQIPYLARHFRVVAYDGRGNGHSDRPRSRRLMPRASS